MKKSIIYSKAVITILFLALIYSVSIFFTKDLINNNVNNNDLAIIDYLTSFENWNEKGLSHYKYAPVLTWQNEGDKFIAYYKRLEDKEGNNFYVSYGPLSYYTIYLLSSMFQDVPDKLFILLFAMLWHFLGAILVFLIIIKICNLRFSITSLPALFGFIVYTFSAPLLYSNIFHFFAENFVLPLALLSILFFIDYIKSEFRLKRFMYLSVFFCFLSIYSEWYGVFLAFVFFLMLFINRKNNKRVLLDMLVVGIVSALAVAVIVFQYSIISGIGDLKSSMSLRFLERSGYFGNTYSDQRMSLINPEAYKLLFWQFHKSFVPFGYFIIALFIIFRIRKIKYEIIEKKSLFLLFTPLALHFLIFFNANVLHFFYMSKLIMVMSIFGAIILNKFMSLYRTHLINISFMIISAILIFISFIHYNNIKTIDNKSAELDKIAKIITDNA
ncbi:MAG: hypothetical protein ABIJ97_03875, partial [Bacteroidota bacterium]